MRHKWQVTDQRGDRQQWQVGQGAKSRATDQTGNRGQGQERRAARGHRARSRNQNNKSKREQRSETRATDGVRATGQKAEQQIRQKAKQLMGQGTERRSADGAGKRDRSGSWGGDRAGLPLPSAKPRARLQTKSLGRFPANGDTQHRRSSPAWTPSAPRWARAQLGHGASACPSARSSLGDEPTCPLPCAWLLTAQLRVQQQGNAGSRTQGARQLGGMHVLHPAD